MKYIELKYLQIFLSSFLKNLPIGNFLYCAQLLFVFIMAKLIQIDITDLYLDSEIATQTLGARFIIRVFQLYLFKISLYRFKHLMSYRRLSFGHMIIIFSGLFMPMSLGHFPYLVIALILIPRENFMENFKTSNSLRYY